MVEWGPICLSPPATSTVTIMILVYDDMGEAW